MLPEELLRQVRELEIRSKRAVNDLLAGQYHSAFKGRGMEFDQVREYVPGDDVRAIDWNVTARFGRPFVKEFAEERELTVMLMVDCSASQSFGTVRRAKSAAAAELAALLAFSAIRNNDKVGLIMFTDRVEKSVVPKKGRTHVLRVIREVLAFEPAGTGTDISGALEYLWRVTPRHAVVFLVSDFLAAGFERILGVVARRHDFIAVHMVDPREVELSSAGVIELVDAETGEGVRVDTSSWSVRKEYAAGSAARRARLARLFKSKDAGHVEIRTDESPVTPLVRFFHEREAMR